MSKLNLFFDVDGVLVHGYHARPELQKRWDENIEQDLGISQARFKEFIFGPFVNEVIIGKRKLQEALTEELPKMGFTGSAQQVVDYWLEHDSNVNHELVKKIKQLKSSGLVNIYIATNQEHNRAKYLMESLSFSEFADDMFNSGRVGVLKPELGYFEYIKAQLNLNHEENQPVFFDDTPKVVEAAKAFGWEAIEFLTVDDLFKSQRIARILNKDFSHAIA